MRAIGIDPGAETGIAVMELRPGARFRWLDHVRLNPKAPALHLALLINIWTPDVVAVEVPSGYVFEHQRGKDLLATGVLAGELIDRARTSGVEVVRASASTWRKALTGKGNAGDDLVRTALERRTDNMPKRSNEHARDAAGVAAYALLDAQLRSGLLRGAATRGSTARDPPGKMAQRQTPGAQRTRRAW